MSSCRPTSLSVDAFAKLIEVREDLEKDELKNLADFYYHERLPAWTDRILFCYAEPEEIKVLGYEGLRDVYISDHK